jgi:hypothetical protein
MGKVFIEEEGVCVRGSTDSCEARGRDRSFSAWMGDRGDLSHELLH